MAEKFVEIVNGELVQNEALVVSSGVPDAGKIAALDTNGKFNISVIPSSGGGNPDWGDIGGIIPNQTDLQAELDLKQNNITSFNGAILQQVSGPGDIQGIPNWIVNNSGGLTQTVTQTTTNSGGILINEWYGNVENGIDSPNENYTLHYNRANIDTGNDEFDLGTNGRSFTFQSNDFFSITEADIGEFSFINSVFEVGENGAGPKNVNGFSYAYGFGQFRNNVNILGGMQGYGFQPFFESGSTVQDTSFLNAFYDSLNAPDTVFSFYTSVSLSPNIGGILNNRNMTSININPQVAEMFGNSGYQGVGIFGTFGDFGASGFYNGLNISPTISSVPNATMIQVSPTIDATNVTGLRVDMTNATGTNVSAAQFIGDVSINGNLSFSGALSTGQINAFYQSNVVSEFVPTSLHSLISASLAPNGVVTNNADTIGLNTAMLMSFEEDSVTTSGGFGLGICATAMPAVVYMETTATIDNVRGGVFALNLDASSTGGTIATATACWATIIPNGVTTVSKYVGYDATLPFGTPNADDSWGYYCDTDIYNYMRGSLVIGSTQQKTTNSSVALEISGTTKAMLNARMTTTERNALTAVNGMQIYNTTTDKLQTYAAGSWVDLH